MKTYISSVLNKKMDICKLYGLSMILKVLSFLSLISLIFFFTAEVEGYASWCDVNQTVFVTQGSTGTFRTSYQTNYFYNLYFEQRSPVRKRLANAWKLSDKDNMTVDIFDNYWADRTQIVGHQHNESQMEVRITVRNISMSDNGTYRMMMDFDRNDCWILFVMQMTQEPSSAVEENKPVYIYAHPRASLITRPLVNATMVWLLDGLSANQSGSFIQYDGFIWIAPIRRDMFGRNVTYRAIQDNGAVNDVNYTLDLTYGPSQPLTIIPEKKQYYMTSGDLMPSITCNTDCKPSCSISWGNHSPGSTLNLGRVTIDTTGDYTCSARRTGVGNAVRETIHVYVVDNTSVTVAIAGLASVQAITTLALGICAFLIYKRTNGTFCHMLQAMAQSRRSIVRNHQELNWSIMKI